MIVKDKKLTNEFEKGGISFSGGGLILVQDKSLGEKMNRAVGRWVDGVEYFGRVTP